MYTIHVIIIYYLNVRYTRKRSLGKRCQIREHINAMVFALVQILISEAASALRNA